MAILGFEDDDIARLIALVETQGLDELILEEEGRYLRIRGPQRARSAPPEALAPSSSQTVYAPAPPPARRALPTRAKEKPAADAPGEGQVALFAPMVGVFYRSDKPGAPPFAEVGQRIAVGQTIGIIEAMKIFSEVPAEHSGVIVAFPAQDGHLVQAGSPLVIIQTD